MFWGGHLQILAQSFYLLNEEVNIRLRSGWVRDDHPEKVGLVPLRLVANHGRARLHHQRFDFGGHLVMENTKQNSRPTLTPLSFEQCNPFLSWGKEPLAFYCLYLYWHKGKCFISEFLQWLISNDWVYPIINFLRNYCVTEFWKSVVEPW